MTYNPRLKGSIISAATTSTEIPPRINGSGGSVNRTDAARIDTSGQVQKVDVSVEAQANACLGVCKDSVANGEEVGIVTSGRLEDVTVSGSFGDTMYISKTGSLTHLQADIGENGFVAGDFVVAVGVIVKNQTNPLLKDLLVNVRVVGQL